MDTVCLRELVESLWICIVAGPKFFSSNFRTLQSLFDHKRCTVRADPALHSGDVSRNNMNVTDTVVHIEKDRGGGKIIERQSSSFKIQNSNIIMYSLLNYKCKDFHVAFFCLLPAPYGAAEFRRSSAILQTAVWQGINIYSTHRISKLNCPWLLPLLILR